MSLGELIDRIHNAEKRARQIIADAEISASQINEQAQREINKINETAYDKIHKASHTAASDAPVDARGQEEAEHRGPVRQNITKAAGGNRQNEPGQVLDTSDSGEQAPTGTSIAAAKKYILAEFHKRYMI